jgi:hypothetical protein
MASHAAPRVGVLLTLAFTRLLSAQAPRLTVGPMPEAVFGTVVLAARLLFARFVLTPIENGRNR